MSIMADKLQSGALVAVTIGVIRLAIVVSETSDGQVTMMTANPGIDVIVVNRRALDGLLHVMVLA